MDCGCGRSPTAECLGWHNLSEEEYRVALEQYNVQNSDIRNQHDKNKDIDQNKD